VDIVQLLILAALGVMGGVLSGLVDGGGGIIFVPALVYAAGWDIKEAVAASLVVVIFASLSPARCVTSRAKTTLTGGWRRSPPRLRLLLP
jgi:uncharacterized membrane protein YfcA